MGWLPPFARPAARLPVRSSGASSSRASGKRQQPPVEDSFDDWNALRDAVEADLHLLAPGVREEGGSLAHKADHISVDSGRLKRLFVTL